MDIMIRTCVLADYPDIALLNKEDLGYDYPDDKTKIKLEKLLFADTDKIFVAELDGEIVGYVHANDYDVIYAPHMKNIMGIAVSSKCRKMGIGKLLLQAVDEWAIKTGAVGIRLVSGATRTDAHSFYYACGYSRDKTQINFKKFFSGLDI